MKFYCMQMTQDYYRVSLSRRGLKQTIILAQMAIVTSQVDILDKPNWF